MTLVDVLLSRRSAAYLLGFGVFQWIIWPTFLKNIWKDPRSFSHGSPTAFLTVHLVLTVVSLILGTGVLVIGWRGVRGTSQARDGHQDDGRQDDGQPKDGHGAEGARERV